MSSVGKSPFMTKVLLIGLILNVGISQVQGNALGGLDAIGGIGQQLSSMASPLLNAVPNTMSMLTGLGAMGGKGGNLASQASSLVNQMGTGLNLQSTIIDGLASGLTAAAGLNPTVTTSLTNPVLSQFSKFTQGVSNVLTNGVASGIPGLGTLGLGNNLLGPQAVNGLTSTMTGKALESEAIVNGAAIEQAASRSLGGLSSGYNYASRANLAGAEAAARTAGAISATNALSPAGVLGSAGALGAAYAAGSSLGAAGALAAGNSLATASALGAGHPLGVTGPLESVPAPISEVVLPASAPSVVGPISVTPTQVVDRDTLAVEADRNAKAESAIAGGDMVAHGMNNARSASLASNAYRQAKLASSRDRVNIAGTIQNTARISDAAIATHDAVTKAEDSLLGSEVAVDSAGTVLDSDAAYIPPVTNSLLRSLPYGRLGLRNIVPKPLTYPSSLLPDVWLNGAPVNYFNVPFRKLQSSFYGTLGPNGIANAANALGGQFYGAGYGAPGSTLPHIQGSGQPLYAANGILLNGLIIDPLAAYYSGALSGLAGSSVYPVLINGQIEALDEVNLAHLITQLQQGGLGMPNTYNGFASLNPVPLLTGSVSDTNLAPTTTIGTTYPIGSALVIEPRDSYFQDYIDNASSRQNFDERHQ